MNVRAVAFALLFATALAHAKGSATSCATALVATPHAWGTRYQSFSQGRGGFLTWPMVLETLTELPPDRRDALFDVGRCDGPDCRWAAQSLAAAQGLATAEIEPLAMATDRLVAASYADRHRPPWRAIREEIEAHERLPAAVRAELREKIALRYRVHRAIERFLDRQHPYYRAKLEGDALVFPDGARRAVTRGFWGRRYVWIPYRDVIRTQDYENPGLVARYREKAGLGFWGFEAYLAPDGRVVIVDQHHRTTAYAQRNAKRGARWEDTLLPFRLEPKPDGALPTLTHWNILASAHQVPNASNSLRWRCDPEWSFLTTDLRDALLTAAELDDWVPSLRDWYGKSTGLAPVLD